MARADNRFGNLVGDADFLAQSAEISGLAPVHSGLVDDFLVHLGRKVAQQKASRETWLVRRRQLRIWIRFLEASGIHDQATTAAFGRFQTYLIDHYRPSTTAGVLDAVRLLYRWTDTIGAHPDITAGVAPMIARPEPNRLLIPTLTQEQVLELLHRTPVRTLVDQRNRALILLLVGAAVETISVQRALVGDVDFKRGEWRFQPRGHRSKDAIAVLLPNTVKALTSYLNARGHREPHEPLIMSHSLGGPSRLSTLSMRLIIHRILGLAVINPPKRALTTTTLRRSGLAIAREEGGLDLVASHTSSSFKQRTKHHRPKTLVLI